MNANTGFPHQVHWDSFQLADAVPRRLHELYHFDVRSDAPGTRCANGGPERAHRVPASYVPASTLPRMFHVD